MRSNELNYRWCRLIGLSLVAALGLGALLPGQAISHTRHVDSGNIHMWWDTNTNYSFGNGGLCGIRDLNGDGHPDVLIGRPEYSAGGKGSVLAFSGREGKGVLGTITGTKANEAFGYAIAVIGDVDKDSFDDFVVAAPNATVGTKVQAGYVQLYSGKVQAGKFTLLHTFTGSAAKGQFGYSVAGPGDVDGDGIPDIAIGEPGDIAKVSGAVHVYSGNPRTKFPLIFHQGGTQIGERYGNALAAAGDVNTDKRADVIVGAEKWDGPGGNDHGRAEALAWAGATSPRVVQFAAGAGLRPGDNYGRSVDRVGVVRSPLYGSAARVIVGAPNNDNTGTDAGMASVVAPGKPWIKTIQVLGNSAYDYLGYRVAGAGDVDLDGTPDFAVSAPYDDPVSRVADSGSVYVYSTKTQKVIAQRFHPDVAGCNRYGLRYGVSLARAGDIDQDDFEDLLVGCDWWYKRDIYCRSWVRHQRRVYLETLVTQHLYADHGHAIISKGGLNVQYNIQVGTAYAKQLVVFLGSGPHNSSRPKPLCFGNVCVPIDMTSLWFRVFALSGALNPVIVRLDVNGNATVWLRLPGWTGAPLPWKIYFAGLVFKPSGPFKPILGTNGIPLWIR